MEKDEDWAPAIAPTAHPLGHPAVAEAAVIGVSSEKWGETVTALIVLKEGQQATEQELIDQVHASC